MLETRTEYTIPLGERESLFSEKTTYHYTMGSGNRRITMDIVGEDFFKSGLTSLMDNVDVTEK